MPQLTDFKQVRPLASLTLVETGTYTHSMTLGALPRDALHASSARSRAPNLAAAQAIERALYGHASSTRPARPSPTSVPSDFIVREDNMSREVLRVGRANEPMQIALLVDTSTAARNNIAHYRTALPPFVAMLTTLNETGPKNQVAIIATANVRRSSRTTRAA